MKDLPLRLKVFFILVYIFTIITIVLSFKYSYVVLNLTSFTNILFFSIIFMLTESFTVAFNNISFSTSFAIQLASFMLFGPVPTLIIIIVGFSLRVLKINGTYKYILNTPVYGTVYNYCILLLPIICGNFIFTLLHGKVPIVDMFNFLPQIIIFSLIVLIINTLLISILYSLKVNKNVLYFFIGNIKLALLNILAMAPFGMMLTMLFNQYSYFGVLLVICPIVLARYTFSLYIQSKNQYIQTVDTLMRAMEARDKYTEGHSQRVAEIATMIARELKYSDLKIEQITMASMLHDVGKIGIDDSILNKPGRLTNEEYEIIKSHPNIGYSILKDIKNLENILPIVKYHHERYDGKGYPEGKRAEELDLDVFIIQLADSIDAMATDRPYRKALTKEQINSELIKYSGTQFHPKIVEAYFNILERQKKAV